MCGYCITPVDASTIELSVVKFLVCFYFSHAVPSTLPPQKKITVHANQIKSSEHRNCIRSRIFFVRCSLLLEEKKTQKGKVDNNEVTNPRRIPYSFLLKIPPLIRQELTQKSTKFFRKHIFVGILQRNVCPNDLEIICYV